MRNALGDRFKEVLDTFTRTYNGHDLDRQRMIDAFEWLYNQGEQASLDDVAGYMESQGWIPEWAGIAGTTWEIVSDLLDRQARKRDSRFAPPGANGYD